VLSLPGLCDGVPGETTGNISTAIFSVHERALAAQVAEVHPPSQSLLEAVEADAVYTSYCATVTACERVLNGQC
jgi:hypothetical protein